MKKREILDIVIANKTMAYYEKLLSYTEGDRKIKTDRIAFPNVIELKEEFDVLKKEINQGKEAQKKLEGLIERCDCDHHIRLEHLGLFWSTFKCVLCEKSIDGDNVCNWELSSNRNKYCVQLVSKYQSCEDGPWIYEKGYSKEDVWQMILEILKNYKDEDEVDLVQEFKKLNLVEGKINEEPRILENFILIIGGTNKQYIDKESYFFKDSLMLGMDFIKVFSGLMNTKVKLIDNIELLDSYKFKETNLEKDCSLKFVGYSTIKELEIELKRNRQIPFKLIIDLSDLYNYNIVNNEIIREKYELNLKEMFPDSYVVRISNLSQKSLEELSTFLRLLQDEENLYAYNQNEYYYLENNEVKKSDFKDTCVKIKRLLRK